MDQKLVNKNKFLFWFQDAFSLLAYCDPYNSPVSYQLEPEQRELTAAAVNSAILGIIAAINFLAKSENNFSLQLYTVNHPNLHWKFSTARLNDSDKN